MDSSDATLLPQCQVRLVCVVCGQVGELESGVDDALKEQIRRQTGFTAEIVQVDASGTCRLCSQRKN